MDKISDERVRLVLDYAKLYPNIPEEQAKELLNTYTNLEQRLVEKRNAYLKKFAKVLPPGQGAEVRSGRDSPRPGHSSQSGGRDSDRASPTAQLSP